MVFEWIHEWKNASKEVVIRETVTWGIITVLYLGDKVLILSTKSRQIRLQDELKIDLIIVNFILFVRTGDGILLPINHYITSWRKVFIFSFVQSSRALSLPLLAVNGWAIFNKRFMINTPFCLIGQKIFIFFTMGKDHLDWAVSQSHPRTFFISLFIQNTNIVQTLPFALNIIGKRCLKFPNAE